MTTELITYFGAYLVIINLITWILFGIDKNRARSGDWRISERALLTLAAIGGTPGAFAARRVFRHKTRKRPFVDLLWIVLVLQVLSISYAVYLLLSRQSGLT